MNANAGTDHTQKQNVNETKQSANHEVKNDSCTTKYNRIDWNSKMCVSTQFELSKITLKNLNRFDLSPTAKLVLLALVDCYNPRTEGIFPKQKTIAEQLGISVSSVIRAIKELAHAQIVIYETKSTNRYKLTPTFFTLVKLTAASSQNESLSCNANCQLLYT